MKKFLNRLNSIDQLFALLRVLTLVGGLVWVLLAPIPGGQRKLLFYNFFFFSVYSILLYVYIYHHPPQIRKAYLVVLVLDLIFLSILTRYTGGFHSDFILGFFLLVALHSFYFGLKFGLAVATASALLYLLCAHTQINAQNFINLILRIAFFYLVAGSMGLLSRKEARDRQRIEQLYNDLNRHRAELEQERDKLAKILMGIDAGLVLLNRDQRILWMNRVAEEWFGPVQNLKDQFCGYALWRSSDICNDCPTERCLKSGKIETKEIEFKTDNHQLKFFRVTAAPLMNEAGEIEQILELMQDITREKELNLQMIHKSKLAAIGELASSIAHEINNPLSAIAVCIQQITDVMQSNGHEAENAHDIKLCLQSMKNEIQRCKKITTGLLDISRKSTHRRVPLNLNQVLRNVLMLVRYKAEKEHKNIELDLQQPLPEIIGEADELAQVFINLILNALEFTPTGKSIYIKSGTQNHQFVFVKVQDEGYGIPIQNLNKIFDPFFTTKPRGAGTGLGLAISQRIVRAHGGSIKVESKLHQGTVFTVLLPVARREA
ncbi:two-component system sensor histidine kinase NtrB [Caldithrix abyssi]